MKRIGIISDTHGCWDERFRIHFAGLDEVWHAGDIGDYSIIERFEEFVPEVRAVCGNIDCGTTRRMLPEVLEFSCEGVKVWLTHIAGYPGRYSPGVKRILRDNDIRLMVCGHSHILKVIPDRELNLLHVNPGAAGYSGWHKVRTLIRLTLDNGEIKDLEVIELARNRIYEKS